MMERVESTDEPNRAHMRYEARRALRQVVEAATRQGSLEHLVRYPDVLVAFVILEHPVVHEAFASEMVTFQELRLWLDVLLERAAGRGGRGAYGTVC